MAVWPGDPPTTINTVAPTAAHPYQSSSITMSAHAGTHVDGPRHLDPAGAGVESFPVDLCLGDGLLVDVSSLDRVDSGSLEEHVSGASTERLLLRTRSPDEAPIAPSSITEYTALDPSAAELLIHSGCRLVGTDAASIGAPDEEGERVHRLLLDAGVWVLEGLLLDGVAPGPIELLCLPLAITDCDGAPTRALARRLDR